MIMLIIMTMMAKMKTMEKIKTIKKEVHLVADTGWILGIDTARRHTSASALATPELNFGI